MSRIVVVGSMNMDLVNEVEHFPQPGETIHGLGTSYNPGGKGANQAVAAARAGADVSMVGAVGTDPFGETLRKSLQEYGVQTEAVAVKPTTSGLAFITVNREGENQIILSAGSNGQLAPGDVPESLLEQAGAVLLQNEIPWETNLHVMRTCRQSGTRVLFNPAPARKLESDLFPLIDTLIVNETEMETLTNREVTDPESCERPARELIDAGISRVIVTLGSRGAFYADARQEIFTPAFKVRAVDTTAAGDTFIGAFAAAWSQGLDMRQAVKFATAAAALAVTRKGAQSSIPSRQEIERMLLQDS